ncbi:MAG: dihydroorotate dehydrogenase [Fusobacteriaceae bacterium]|jgi:dihydroorotate dehydrogenase (NAD+) catalytic subunit|nr:dihydroorotate dehydrogenase [Fusobacteriaceae bacterium]
MTPLQINFLGTPLKNPVATSSGCFGFGLEYRDYFDPDLLGAIGLKGTTLRPRMGNMGTRVTETPAGMLNTVGLENPGVRHVKDATIPEIRAAKVHTPLIFNLSGSTMEDYVEGAKIVDTIDDVAFLELNISCPNVKDGGMAFGANPCVAGEVTAAVRKQTKKPLIVKLTPNVNDVAAIAKIVEEAGADAISVINTLLGMAIDVRTRKPVLGNIFGGLSGPAVKPVALRIVYQVYKAVKIPIVGMGGISSTEDALEFIFAGATLVSVGTGIFKNPLLPVEIIQGLEKYCVENGVSNIEELVGAAHR